MAGFIGLALSVLRGLKAGPKEIVILLSIMPAMHGFLVAVSLSVVLFFHMEAFFRYTPSRLWLELLSGLVMGFSMALILAKSVDSHVRKRQIPWTYLYRMSRIALVAAVVLIAVAIFYSPKTCRIDSLFVVSLMYWLLACWIRHEAYLSAIGETVDTSSKLLPQDFVVLKKIAVAVLILAVALTVFLLGTSFYGIYYVAIVFRYLVVFLLGAALLMDGKARPNRSDTLYSSKSPLWSNKLFAWGTLVFLVCLTVRFSRDLSIIIKSIYQMCL